MKQRHLKPSARADMPALAPAVLNALDWMWEDIEELKNTERPPPMEETNDSIAAAIKSHPADYTEADSLISDLTILTSGTAPYVSVKRDFLVRLLESYYRRLAT